jgi:hypothetical protein
MNATILVSNENQIKFYAGIGSRSTPSPILKLMYKLGKALAYKGLGVRHGDAIGSDQAFNEGAIQLSGQREVFRTDNWKKNGLVLPYETEILKEAQLIASTCHPNWNNLDDYSRKLHTRNVFQILGIDLKTPVAFVLCWTPDGAETKTSSKTGGTGQAIRLANSLGIRVTNLQHPKNVERAETWLASFDNNLLKEKYPHLINHSLV